MKPFYYYFFVIVVFQRFKKSEPVVPWTGVRDALHWPPHCVQNKLNQYEYLTKILNYSTSEDCLYLNIWSPHRDIVRLANRTNRVRTNALLPVVIFIHGGAFNYMGVSMAAYYGGVVASLGNVIMVTINYRGELIFYILFYPSNPIYNTLG